MTNETPKLVTAEEFERWPETNPRCELVRGVVVESPYLGARDGRVVVSTIVPLATWAEHHNRGVVGMSAGCVLARNPDTVRVPYGWFVSHERMPASEVPTGFLQFAPDLAVEIITPYVLEMDLHRKIHEYFAAGGRMVWTVYPDSKSVVVHHPHGHSRTYRAGDTLRDLELLPGFECPVVDIFTL